LLCVILCITFAYIMKDETIIIRVNKDMKAKLIKLAEENRREMSDFIRLVFEDTIKKKIKV